MSPAPAEPVKSEPVAHEKGIEEAALALMQVNGGAGEPMRETARVAVEAYLRITEPKGARGADVFQLVHDSAALVAENDVLREVLEEIRDGRVWTFTDLAEEIRRLREIARKALASQPAATEEPGET